MVILGYRSHDSADLQKIFRNSNIGENVTSRISNENSQLLNFNLTFAYQIIFSAFVGPAEHI